MIALFATGILLSIPIAPAAFLITAFIATPVLIIYSRWLKRQPLAGNIAVAFMLGLSFIFVGAAFGNIRDTLPMAALAFGFTLIRELIKDLEDMSGDAIVHARTLPLVLGETATVRVTLVLMAAFCLLDLTPYYFGIYNAVFFWLVLLGINIPLVFCALALGFRAHEKNYHRIQVFLKLNIFVGLAAIYLGRSA